MRTHNSHLAQALEPFVAGLWIFFLIDSLFVAAVWAFGIGDAKLAQWIPNPDLVKALAWLIAHGDLLWIILGAAHVYLCFAAQDGLATARGWGIVIITSVVAIAWASVSTGYPLGPIEYSSQLGMKLGPVPVGLPLLWLAVILAAREAVLAYHPRWSQGRIALGVGALAALTDLNLEPLAARVRGFWFWRGNPPTLPPVFDFPLWSPLVWGLLACALGLILRELDVLAAVRQRRGKSAAPFLVFNAVFLVAHIGRWVRH